MNDLKERYVSAVLRAIPEDQRSDVDRELRAAIDDAVDARIEMGDDPGVAEEAVLNDLGDPDRLASEYSGKPLWVIGPRYYLAWIRLTKRLLTIVPPLVGVVTGVVRYAIDSNAVDAVWGGIWAAWIAVLNVLFWTAVGFVIAERVEYSAEVEIIPMGKWKVDYLPRVPDRQIGLVETIGAAFIQLLTIGVLVAVLAIPNIPILNPTIRELAVPLALGLMVVSLGFTLVKYRVGKWTTGLAIFNALLNLAFTALWFWILVVVTVINPEAVPEWNTEDWVVPTSIITVAVIAAVCVWDTIEGFSQARKARR